MSGSNIRYGSRCGQQGFTLLEALIAFVVLAGGLLAAFRFHSTTMSVTAESKVRTEAIALAKHKLEALRNFQTVTEFNTIVVDGNGLGDYAGVDYAADFTMAWDRDEAYGNGDNPRKVTVTVSWTDKENQSESVMLSSILWRTEPAENAAELALALNSGGDPGGGWGDENGNPISIGGNGGGGVVVITDVTIQDAGYNGDIFQDDRSYFNIEFFGDIIFTDEGLASVGISGSPQYSAGCDIVELERDDDGGLVYRDGGGNIVADPNDGETSYVVLPGGTGGFKYRCNIVGVPDTSTWFGILTYTPSGNDAVCSPGTTLDLSITQQTTFLELEVVVLTNGGACNQTL